MTKMFTIRELWKTYYQGYVPFRSFRKLLMADLIKSKIVKIGTLVRCHEDSADWLFEQTPAQNPRLKAVSDDLTV